MKKYLAIPMNIQVDLHEMFLHCKGPLGTIKLEIPSSLRVELDKKTIVINTNDKGSTKISRKTKSILGTFNSLLKNTIKGINIGHFKQLNLVGVGYRVEDLEHGKFNFKLGYSNNIMIENDEEALINLLKPTIIQVKGTNKQKVSQKAAELRKLRSPEPYKGKGILYKNETLIRKEGKKLS